MAALSEEKIIAIIKAYNEIGTYSGVAKKLQCSPATVKKYVEKQNEYNIISNKNIILFNSKILEAEELSYKSLKDFILSAQLTQKEIKEIEELWEEL